METVLGLSLTPTAVGWVLVEGRDADGTIVDHDDFEVHTGGAARAANTSEQVTAAVLRAQAAATLRDQRLHVVGVTWSDDAAAAAALLLESLTEAGFDNVVPIRLLAAAEMVAQGIAPVVGSDHDPDALWWELEKALPVPVFTQSGAPLALARGAALASTQSMEFTDTPMAESTGGSGAEPVRPRARSYAGALTMLVTGAVTLAASVSLAVGPRLLPDRPAQPVEHVVHKSTPAPVAKAPVPPPAEVTAPDTQAAPEPAPPEEPTVAAAPIEPQSAVSAERSSTLPEAEPAPAPPPPPEPNPHPLLTKLLERLHGHPADPAPEEPAPAQVPPPNAGPPSP